MVDQSVICEGHGGGGRWDHLSTNAEDGGASGGGATDAGGWQVPGSWEIHLMEE